MSNVPCPIDVYCDREQEERMKHTEGECDPRLKDDDDEVESRPTLKRCEEVYSRKMKDYYDALRRLEEYERDDDFHKRDIIKLHIGIILDDLEELRGMMNHIQCTDPTLVAERTKNMLCNL